MSINTKKEAKILEYLLENWKKFEPLAQYPYNYSVADQVKDKFHITYDEAARIVNDARLLRECFK